MPARTTSDAVIATLGNNYDALLVSNLTTYIADAGGIVDDLVIYNAANAGLTLSSGLLEFLERYLAAHFYAYADQIFKYKQTGNAAASFQGSTGMGYKSSLYGQAAIARDPTGYLAMQSAKAEDADAGGGVKKASMFWAGTEPT